MEWKKIEDINKTLKTIDQKGKPYVTVDERVKAFRQLCPGGGIITEMVHYQDGKVVIKATVTDEDGQVLSTGYAEEIEGNGFVNKTSFVENAETSAVGRALGFLYLGATSSIASYDEVRNAQEIQATLATEREIKNFTDVCKILGVDYKEIGKQAGAKSLKTMTKEQHGKAMLILKDLEENGQ